MQENYCQNGSVQIYYQAWALTQDGILLESQEVTEFGQAHRLMLDWDDLSEISARGIVKILPNGKRVEI